MASQSETADVRMKSLRRQRHAPTRLLLSVSLILSILATVGAWVQPARASRAEASEAALASTASRVDIAPSALDNVAAERAAQRAQTDDPADLRVVTTVKPHPTVLAGEQFTYTILVDNLGPDPAVNVVITDTLVTSGVVDANGCSIAIRTDGGAIDEFDCNFAASSGVFDLGTFGSNQLNPRSPSDPGRIIVTINATASGNADLTSFTTVTSDTPDPDLSNNLAITDLTVVSEADLRLVKMVSPSPTVRAGEQFTYTLIVDNLGPSTAQNVVITDTLVTSAPVDPNGCSIAIRTDGGAIDEFDCTFALSSGVFDLGTFGSNHLNARSPSDPGRIIVTINATADSAVDLENLASVVSDTPDPDMDNNYASAPLSITAVADLTVSKTAQGQVQVSGQPGRTFAQTADQVTAGGLVTYTLVVTNSGPSVAENVLLRDELPLAMSVVAAATSKGSCTAGQSPQCGLGYLAPGEVVTAEIAAKVDASVAGDTVLNNQTLITSDTFDDDNSGNLDSAPVTVSAAADLWIQMSQSPASVVQGDLTYVIVAGNVGPSTPPTALIADMLPAELEHVTWECNAFNGASCPPSGSGNVEAHLTLPTGSNVVLTVRATLPRAASITNTATISPVNGPVDPYTVNNAAFAVNATELLYLPILTSN